MRVGLVALLLVSPLQPLLVAAHALQATEQVDIYYDDSAIPHIFAESDEGALFGLGYQQMREHPIGTLDRFVALLWALRRDRRTELSRRRL